MYFDHSPKAKEIISRVQQFMDEHIFPLEREYLGVDYQNHADWKNWELDDRIERLKKEAKSAGLWNLFLPPVSGF
jgi:acyl-CoA dehydrogenase